ncbi:MAG: hypothetical protein ACHQ2Z_08515 [Elusimicrobiota bacterium]
MKRATILPVLLLAAAGRAAAKDLSLNPDHWKTIEVTEGGSSSMKGDQIVYSKGPDVDNNRRTLNTNSSFMLLLPLAEDFTLVAGAGGDWTETDTAGGNGTNAADESQVTYQLGGRHYFESAHGAGAPESENPDRWTSLGLTFSGLATINHSAGNAAGNFTQEQGTVNSTLTADTRVPVSDAWTLLAGLSGTNSYAKLEPTPTSAGSRTNTDSLSLSGGFRYYFVGKNLISDDGDLNPDKWIMLSLVLGAGGALHSRQTITTQAGPDAGQRDNQTRAYTATLTTRIPITDHASLAFSTNASYNRTFTPFLPSANGALTRGTPIGFSASLRYFLF